MTWEETIRYIRTEKDFSYLVEKAYLDGDLKLNIERFAQSEEFGETLLLISEYAPRALKILDVGSGNGISAINFARNGFEVVAVEPDPSETIGAGAIRKLKELYQLNSISIFEDYAENFDSKNGLFDIIYVRQAMHHANHLNDFIKNLSTLLKPKGLFMTVRDHVIFNTVDKDWFLQSHPLHRFYGGENAFTSDEYEQAFENANLNIIKKFSHFDSVINYYPLSKKDFSTGASNAAKQINHRLVQKLGRLGNLKLLNFLYKKKIGFREDTYYNEKNVPGRLYSYILQKK